MLAVACHEVALGVLQTSEALGGIQEAPPQAVGSLGQLEGGDLGYVDLRDQVHWDCKVQRVSTLPKIACEGSGFRIKAEGSPRAITRSYGPTPPP